MWEINEADVNILLQLSVLVEPFFGLSWVSISVLLFQLEECQYWTTISILWQKSCPSYTVR